MNPLGYPFMQNAFAAAVLVALPASLLSCFLVLRGWSLMGDAVSHAILPGVVLAYLAGLPLLAGAFVAGLAATLLSGAAGGAQAGGGLIRPDTRLGIVMSAMFALGLLMFLRIDTGLHLEHVLFGNLLGAGGAELRVMAAVAALTTAAILALRRDLTLVAFDPVQARLAGLRVRALDVLLLALLAATVVAALAAVGALLATALVIAPGATAFLLVRRMGPMLAVAAALGTLGSVIGVALSFWIDAAPAPLIVLVLVAAFLGALARVEWRARRR